MTLIAVTRNHTDLSTDRGFQFRFFCDQCRNGYTSAYRTSKIGVVAGLLRALSLLVGGLVGRASRSAWTVQRAIGGAEHDAALRDAVAEARQHFKLCSHCGRWVCPEACWNHDRGLCESCAPDEHETATAAQAQALASQIRRRASSADLASHVDMSARHVATCGACGAVARGGVYCQACGARLVPRVACLGCGAEQDPGGKHCRSCGAPLAAAA